MRAFVLIETHKKLTHKEFMMTIILINEPIEK